MRKFVAIFAAAAMILSLAACNNEDNNTPPSNNGDNGTTTTTTTAAADDGGSDTTTTTSAAEEEQGGEDTSEGEENPPEDEGPLFPQMADIEAEAIDIDPILHLDFETTDGLKAVEQVENDGSVPEGIPFAIVDSSHEILIAEGQGASGNALYLDGKYGVDFDMPAANDDIYTISLWFNADRVATFGPVVQMGRNIAGQAEPVTWLNFTKSEWGADGAAIFPVAWNRNTAYEVNPWVYAMDNEEHGKREWCMVTVVINGNRYIADDGLDRVETQFYLNGQLMWDANAENMYYQGFSPEIFAGDGLEGHVGINYWDTVYKGFVDELYVYNAALTPGQIKTLYEAGNPPETPVAPETGE